MDRKARLHAHRVLYLLKSIFNSLIMDGSFSGAPQSNNHNKIFHSTLALGGLFHLGGALCIMVPSVQKLCKSREAHSSVNQHSM